MKTKTQHYSILLIVALLSLVSCQNKSANKNAESNKVETAELNIDTNDVAVIYFHATRRCATCEAVEKVSSDFITLNYKDQVKFISINREENKELAKKYGIEWQSLIIVKGDNVTNLTNEAFLNARTNPTKLENKIKSTIDQLL